MGKEPQFEKNSEEKLRLNGLSDKSSVLFSVVEARKKEADLESVVER